MGKLINKMGDNNKTTEISLIVSDINSLVDSTRYLRNRINELKSRIVGDEVNTTKAGVSPNVPNPEPYSLQDKLRAIRADLELIVEQAHATIDRLESAI